MSKLGTYTSAGLCAQLSAGAALMARFEEYAIEIGCTVGTGAMCDSIECDEAQAALLATWWETHTK